MTNIMLRERVGSFASNKDRAGEIRINEIIPAIERGDDVILDFEGVEDATQSFVHALISDLFRRYGTRVLELISFKNCSETVKKIIEIVSDYMQEAE